MANPSKVLNFHFGGQFVSSEKGVVYLGGQIESFAVDTDEMSLIELQDRVAGLTLPRNSVLSYRVAGDEREDGFTDIRNDSDVQAMIDILELYGPINIYVEYGEILEAGKEVMISDDNQSEKYGEYSDYDKSGSESDCESYKNLCRSSDDEDKFSSEGEIPNLGVDIEESYEPFVPVSSENAKTAQVQVDENEDSDNSEHLGRVLLDWMLREDPKFWARCYFSSHAKCNSMDNNISESFNQWIKEYRDKPIITMLEGIRRLLMTRFQVRLEFYEKFDGNVCPKIIKKLEKTSENARNCFALYAGDKVFEVEQNSKSYIVDIGLKSCSCHKWDLRGIPCCHGVSAILADKGHPEDYVDKFYQKDTFFKAYNQIVYPIPDMTTWKNTEGYVILPPQVRVAPGRPKKARRRGPDEPKNPNAVRKYGAAIKCRACKQEGHNTRTCELVNPNKAKSKTKSSSRRVPKQSNKEVPSSKESGPSRKMPRYDGATGNTNGQRMRSVSTSTLNYVADKNKLHSKPIRVGDAVFTTKLASNATPNPFGS